MKKSAALIALLFSAGLILSSCAKDLSSLDSNNTTNPLESESSTSAQTPAPLTQAPETVTTTQVTETIVSAPDVPGIPDICTSRYGYYLLNADEKSVYDQLVSAMRNFQPSATLTRKLKTDTVEEILKLITIEEVDLYYLSPYSELNYNKLTNIVSYVSLSYRFTQTEVEQLDAAANQRVQEILNKIPSGATDISKIKLFHDQIILNTFYNLDYTYGGTPYGALVAGQALCEGYARAFALLCNKVGIENLFAVGRYGEEDHKWNMVRIDGDWYNIDLTWDDPPYDAQGVCNPDYYIQYNYFMYKNGQSGLNLIVDESHFPLPETNSGLYNYFVYYGYYAKSYDQALEILSGQLDYAIKNNRKYIRIKFSSAELYKEACAKLLDEFPPEIFSKDIYPFDKVTQYVILRDPQLYVIQLEIAQLRSE